jgi:malate dehydrogenase (oxaloacetate-decarboxylating)
LHWEDFGAGNAHRILARYQDECCTFNDDIQGTAAVVLAGVLAAVRLKGERLADQRIVIYGAGTAGAGVADIIRAAMVREGVPEAETYSRFWAFNSAGLIVEGCDRIRDFQAPYARRESEVAAWGGNPHRLSLTEAVTHIAPTILIGTSARARAFTEDIVTAMAAQCERPIIMPLSNPTSKSEANPADLLRWTGGRALVATGSPYDEVEFDGTAYSIAQANNALIFPGLGLGVSVVRATRVTDGMIYAAARALAGLANEYRHGAALLPSISNLRYVSSTVAMAVAQTAMDEGVAEVHPEELIRAVYERMWKPKYPELEILDPISAVLPV